MIEKCQVLVYTLESFLWHQLQSQSQSQSFFLPATKQDSFRFELIEPKLRHTRPTCWSCDSLLESFYFFAKDLKTDSKWNPKTMQTDLTRPVCVVPHLFITSEGCLPVFLVVYSLSIFFKNLPEIPIRVIRMSLLILTKYQTQNMWWFSFCATYSICRDTWKVMLFPKRFVVYERGCNVNWAGYTYV